MIPLITKQQIGKHVALTENLAGIDVDMYIQDVQEYDTINVLPTALMQAIEAKVKLKIQQWNKNKTYAIGDLVFYSDVDNAGPYFKAIAVNTDSQPPSVNWEDNELMNFYHNYLVPYMSQAFYYRFTAEHGIKTTQAGLVQIADSSYEPISDGARGARLGSIKSKVNVWINKINKKLSDCSHTFDGTRYLQDNDKNYRVKQGVRIYALGADKSRPESIRRINRDE